MGLSSLKLLMKFLKYIFFDLPIALLAWLGRQGTRTVSQLLNVSRKTVA
jgi:hypothetical protein